MATTICRIITHFRPHFDELLAIRLLKRYGDKLYPGIVNAKIEYCRTGESPEGKSWEEHRAEGTILIGVGGGPFDEHPTSHGQERRIGESASSLVAHDLGFDRHPVFKRLIQLITEADQTGVHELHVASRLKTRYRLHPEDQQIGIDFALDILDDWEHEQMLFLAAQRQLQAMVDTDDHHKLPNNLDLVVVVSDNYKMSAAARSLDIAILIQKQPSGHVQIFCNNERHTFNMAYVAAEVRKAEMRAQGMSKAKIEEILDLDIEGKIPEVLNWFYQVPGNNLLNGSETTLETPPTKLCLDKIVRIVKSSVFVETASA